MRVAYFDLETTGFPTTSEILQIAVETDESEENDDTLFNQYIFPETSYIPHGAQKVHGISIVNGELHKNGERLTDVTSATEGLNDFLEFLEDLRENDDEEIVLCAHNCKRFDSKTLSHNLGIRGLSLPANVKFSDSLSILKKYHQERGNGFNRFLLKS